MPAGAGIRAGGLGVRGGFKEGGGLLVQAGF